MGLSSNSFSVGATCLICVTSLVLSAIMYTLLASPCQVLASSFCISAAHNPWGGTCASFSGRSRSMQSSLRKSSTESSFRLCTTSSGLPSIRARMIFAFGSLDAEVLGLSVKTLSDIADGNRIIGVISHVAELRE
jgi:hypothetical protein